MVLRALARERTTTKKFKGNWSDILVIFYII